MQCAGGMRMHHPIYLKHAREICTQYGAHLIADEIAVGFGRTGTLFACEQADIIPDFMCLSKGLTGGFMPMSAVLTTQHVYESFLDDSRERAFLHSHSYTGNPLACAAALASLNIFSSDDVLANNKITASKMAAHAKQFESHPHVSEVRQTGMILAIEMVRDKKTRAAFPANERRGLRAYQHAIANGVVLRPLGDILYWMPPYCIDDEALQHLSSVTASALEQATR